MTDKLSFTKTIELLNNDEIDELISMPEFGLDRLAWRMAGDELYKLVRGINRLRSARSRRSSFFGQNNNDRAREYACKKELSDLLGIACKWSDFRSGDASENISNEGDLRVSNAAVFRAWIVNMRD